MPPDNYNWNEDEDMDDNGTDYSDFEMFVDDDEYDSDPEYDNYDDPNDY